MRPSVYPRLINGPFEDPGLFVPFRHENRALLFDLGDNARLSARDLLKVSHVFVTHTHMDHFVGFDRLIRLMVGRSKNLHMFGPKGFLKNVEGKLAGYTWNLVDRYENRFVLTVTEIRKDQTITRRYGCTEGFKSGKPADIQPPAPVLMDCDAFSVSAITLNHGIPCLGLRFDEHFHVNIKKNAVLSLGLEIGTWLKAFKDALFTEKNRNSMFHVPSPPPRSEAKSFTLWELAEKISIVTPGQKIAYIVDTGYPGENPKHGPGLGKLVEFLHGVDHLFIEGAFLEADRDTARKKYHLTARQAGIIAARARAKQFTLLHFSPRYSDCGNKLVEEANTAYEDAFNNCA
jgi:ribonuclease Z